MTQLLSANKISAKSGALDWRNEADRVSQSDLAEFSSQSSQPFSSLFRKEDPKLEKFVTLEKNKFDFGRVTNFDEPMQQVRAAEGHGQLSLVVQPACTINIPAKVEKHLFEFDKGYSLATCDLYRTVERKAS